MYKDRQNLYLGDGPECGNAIAVHEDIDKVAFTGSVEVSRIDGNRHNFRL